MRVTTPGLQRDAINSLTTLQAALNERQAQMSSGRRVNKVSDDPIASALISRVTQQIAVNKRFQDNATAAERHLSLSENSLNQYKDVIYRIRELTVQSGNTGNSTNVDRNAIAVELQQLSNQLKSIVNAQGSDSEYLFAGYQSLQQPFTADNTGRYVYNGDQGQRFIQIGSDTQIAVSDPGKDIFLDIPAATGSFATNARSSNLGNGVISMGVISNLTTWQAAVASNTTYTLTYDSGTNQLVQTDSVGSAAVNIPYVSGSDVTVGGVTFSITGSPSNGDVFTLKPAVNQDIFATISHITEALQHESNDTNLVNMIGLTLSNLDSALNQSVQAQTKIGARLNVVEAQTNVNADYILAGETALTKARDVDYTKLITEVSQLSFALEASQKSFARIQSLSIFNYI